MGPSLATLLLGSMLLAPPDAGSPEDAPRLVDVGSAAGVTAGAVEAPSIPPPVAPPRPVLRVVAAGSEPFVVADGKEPTGISVEIWDEIADRAEFDYQITLVDTIADGLDRVAHGQADVLIGPVSVTAERAREVSFTQPYHLATLSILAPEGTTGPFDRLKPFLTRAFIAGVSGLFLVLLLVGVLLWWTERDVNEDQFPRQPVRGIANGLWLALVTMTTVGYGDRAPVSTGGRVVAGIWMVISMITASSLTASIATALTLSQLDEGTINRADQLAGQRVVATSEAPSAEFVRSHRGRLVHAEGIEDAIAKVESGEATAIVYDRPILRYYIAQHPELELVLSDSRYEPRGYGFGVPRGSQHMVRLDIALLQAQEDGEIEAIVDRWLGSD